MTGPVRRLRDASYEVDQVIRAARFTEAHPGVTIRHDPATGGHWTADWTDGDGALRRTVEWDLRLLLDQLDRELGADSVTTTGPEGSP